MYEPPKYDPYGVAILHLLSYIPGCDGLLISTLRSVNSPGPKATAETVACGDKLTPPVKAM